MNIASALKQKNRIAGEIKQLEIKIQRNNKYTDSAQYDTIGLLNELDAKRKGLVDLKAAFSRANVGIAQELVELAEAKGLLSFYNDLAAYCGPAEATQTQGYGEREKEIKVYSQITIQQRDALAETAQNRINELQDIIDAYNATTSID